MPPRNIANAKGVRSKAFFFLTSFTARGPCAGTLFSHRPREKIVWFDSLIEGEWWEQGDNETIRKNDQEREKRNEKTFSYENHEEDVSP